MHARSPSLSAVCMLPAHLVHAAAVEHSSNRPPVTALSITHTQQQASTNIPSFLCSLSTMTKSTLQPSYVLKKTLTHIQTLAVEENPILNGMKLKPPPSITIEPNKPQLYHHSSFDSLKKALYQVSLCCLIIYLHSLLAEAFRQLL